MILGVLFPIICLALFEYYYDLVHKKSVQYERYIAMQQIAQGMTLEKIALKYRIITLIACELSDVELDLLVWILFCWELFHR